MRPLSIDQHRARFMARTKHAGRCLEWQGPRYINSVLKYGRACFQRRATTAHRVAWLLFVGPIPDGLFVLHECDNPLCVKTDHLFLGTHDDNMKDMVRKGRSTAGDIHWTHRMPLLATETAKKSAAARRLTGSCRGAKNANAKLSLADVEKIKAADASYSELARRFGIGKSQIARIRTGQSWA